MRLSCPLCLMTGLSELQFSPPVEIFMWEVHPGPSPQHSPGLSLSYARRGPPPNKQSTALRRHYPGLSLVTWSWFCPLIGWHQLTPSVSRRRRQKYEEQSPLWRNSGRFFPWKILKHNSPQKPHDNVSLADINLWILMSGMNVGSRIYELLPGNTDSHVDLSTISLMRILFICNLLPAKLLFFHCIKLLTPPINLCLHLSIWEPDRCPMKCILALLC